MASDQADPNVVISLERQAQAGERPRVKRPGQIGVTHDQRRLGVELVDVLSARTRTA